jgi:hypothetical protein
MRSRALVLYISVISFALVAIFNITKIVTKAQGHGENGPSGVSSDFFVTDGQGNQVGPVVGTTTFSPQSVGTVLDFNGRLLYMSVGKASLTGNSYLVFTGANCTGQAFMQSWFGDSNSTLEGPFLLTAVGPSNTVYYQIGAPQRINAQLLSVWGSSSYPESSDSCAPGLFFSNSSPGNMFVPVTPGPHLTKFTPPFTVTRRIR